MSVLAPPAQVLIIDKRRARHRLASNASAGRTRTGVRPASPVQAARIPGLATGRWIRAVA